MTVVWKEDDVTGESVNSMFGTDCTLLMDMLCVALAFTARLPSANVELRIKETAGRENTCVSLPASVPPSPSQFLNYDSAAVVTTNCSIISVSTECNLFLLVQP